MMTISNRYKKSLLEKINRLSIIEHDEIFKILKAKKESFTQNKNGVFFNLSMVSEEVIKEIELFVDFCIKNKHDLDEYDKKLNECKISNNYTLLQRQDTNPQLDSLQLDAALPPTTGQKSENNWLSLINDNKYNERLASFMECLTESAEKLNKKKSSSKFINAKKKYARKVVNDKKIDNELISDLASEAYLITV
jgi:hypothetical protein